MLIGGLLKFTLSDYPGKIACIVFTQGCNFRCLFCHNGHLLPARPPSPDTLIDETEFFEFLEKRKGKLDGVVITGGEPTIHKDLPEFIRKIKDMGFLVKLDTNGSSPAMVRRLLDEKVLDMIALDVKAPLDADKYSHVCGVDVSMSTYRETLSLIVSSGVRHELRTTVVPQLHSEEDIEEIARSVPPEATWKKQKFIAANALDPTLRVAA